ncbi:DUF503 domain-containing protein [Anaerocolumna aminovalerica]|jgi:uncharacterized protein YlxP (DUF503 family)|uniref:DUF503 domain-containing protein n=1 Tax=Anaerocolumna aminovalerica TaxID=1527 RepID=A0A1I5J1B8_9FIRM|nr:DUF503 domain-containing protein [Anaerocolumna aminovalerica]MDU6266560.1 DUF503 domain-containing protein [Anaerocolumna aminovalerica]SFO66423.1 hypothetical protein SAMN04489757_1617 [Anaerocolumna aminovalerica]
MIIGSAKIIIHVPWVHSLKEKRMTVKSLCAKVSNKFNVSIAEVENQDMHQSIGLGIACVTTDSRIADSMIDTILNFIESNTEGEIMHVEREIL